MGKDLIVKSNQLRNQVSVVARNRISVQDRRNVLSCVYARPFDRMPVEDAHLHRSLEGVTPTEALSFFTKAGM